MSGGIANITVSNKNNQIIVIPGANSLVDKNHIKSQEKALLECGIMGAMFEVPIESIMEANRICKENDIKFVLD